MVIENNESKKYSTVWKIILSDFLLTVCPIIIFLTGNELNIYPFVWFIVIIFESNDSLERILKYKITSIICKYIINNKKHEWMG